MVFSYGAGTTHSTFLAGKLRQEVCHATDSEGGGVLSQLFVLTKTGRPAADVLREKHPDMYVPLVGNFMCAPFKEYKEVTKTVTLDFSEDGAMWVEFKLSGATGVLVA